MGATKNLNLTQFEPDTVTNWLEQYNKDMLKIDDFAGEKNVAATALEERLTSDEINITNNRNQINENTQDIANIKNDISEIEGGDSGASLKTLNDRIVEVETGLQTATTDITTVTNKANATAIEVETIDSRLETVEEDSATLSRIVGMNQLDTGKTLVETIGSVALPKNISYILSNSYPASGAVMFNGNIFNQPILIFSDTGYLYFNFFFILTSSYSGNIRILVNYPGAIKTLNVSTGSIIFGVGNGYETITITNDNKSITDYQIEIITTVDNISPGLYYGYVKLE